MDYTEIYPPRLVLCRDWKELQRCETTSRSMYGTSRQKSLCLRSMISASVSRHKKHGRNARNEIHTRRPVRCIVIICTKGKVACKCNEKSEDSPSQRMYRPWLQKGKQTKGRTIQSHFPQIPPPFPFLESCCLPHWALQNGNYTPRALSIRRLLEHRYTTGTGVRSVPSRTIV